MNLKTKIDTQNLGVPIDATVATKKTKDAPPSPPLAWVVSPSSVPWPGQVLEWVKGFLAQNLDM